MKSLTSLSLAFQINIITFCNIYNECRQLRTFTVSGPVCTDIIEFAEKMIQSIDENKNERTSSLTLNF